MSYLDTYLGQLDAGLSDPAVMELAINADGSIWVERAGQIHMTPSGLPALPARAVRDLASQIANSTSNTFTETAPLVSAAVSYRDLMLRCQVVGSPAVASGTGRKVPWKKSAAPWLRKFVQGPKAPMSILSSANWSQSG
jgi:type IV secretory pathway ATPase VirB11/archaellum biosynthesis ATPase